MFRLIKLKNGNNRCEKQERFSNRQHQRYQASNSFVDLPFPGMAEEELKVTSSVLHRVHEASLKVNLTILDYMENHYTNYRLMRGRFFRYGDVFISRSSDLYLIRQYPCLTQALSKYAIQLLEFDASLQILKEQYEEARQ